MTYIQKRVRKNGRASYRALVRVKGFPTISATFDKRYEALKWSQDKEVEFRLNKNSSFTAKNGKRTLGELIDRYSSKVLSHKKDIARQTIQLNWWKVQLGNLMLCDISSSTISDNAY